MKTLTEIIIHNENELDAWFKENYKELGFTYVKRVTSKDIGSPDYIAKRNGKLIRIELETLSSHFISHKHSHEEIDLVLCVAVDKELPIKTEVVPGLKFWKPVKPQKLRSPRLDSRTVCALIENLMREEGTPISSQQIATRLNQPMNRIYYATSILVAAEKIKRYMGFAGIFILEKEAEDSSNTSEVRSKEDI